MTEWVECRRRKPLPEECPVICTIEDKSGKREVQGECFYDKGTGWYISRDFKKHLIEPPYEVIAWMLTPQPYITDRVFKRLSEK